MGTLEESSVSSSAPEVTRHWLLGPHEKLVADWAVFEPLKLGNGYLLSGVPEASVSPFQDFENRVRSRQVGAPLLEHLERFGRYLAFIVWREGQVAAIQRFRLYHEFDRRHRTLLTAYTHVEEASRGKGLGTRLRIETASYFNKQPGVSHLASEAWPDNLASIRSSRNSGFILHHQQVNAKNVLIKDLSEP